MDQRVEWVAIRWCGMPAHHLRVGGDLLALCGIPTAEALTGLAPAPGVLEAGAPRCEACVAIARAAAELAGVVGVDA
jgi:hypothetical protein